MASKKPSTLNHGQRETIGAETKRSKATIQVASAGPSTQNHGLNKTTSSGAETEYSQTTTHRWRVQGRQRATTDSAKLVGRRPSTQRRPHIGGEYGAIDAQPRTEKTAEVHSRAPEGALKNEAGATRYSRHDERKHAKEATK